MMQMIGVDMSLSMLCKTMFFFFFFFIKKRRKENKKIKKRKSPFIVQLFLVSLTVFDWNARLCRLMFICIRVIWAKLTMYKHVAE